MRTRPMPETPGAPGRRDTRSLPRRPRNSGAFDRDAPLSLLLKNGDRYRTVAFDYHDGLRYPRLERIPGTPDRLGDILSPRRR